VELEKENGFPFRHIHATGSYGWEWMPDHIKTLGLDLTQTPTVDMVEYIYNMPTLMAAADIVIGRAGASTCNEIGASGTPCILIPSPNVTNNHQEKNARLLEQRGCAVVLTEGEDMGKKLFDAVRQLLSDREKRSAMSASLRKMVMLDSAEKMCDIIEALTEKSN